MGNKTVLITGSSRGIGKAIAFLFAKNNFNVVINCKKSVQELENTFNELKKINPNILKIQADVSDFEECKAMFSEIKNHFGNVDILINNASVAHFGLFSDLDDGDWNNIIKNNINSVLNCSNIAVKNMIKNKFGFIINISSIWGVSGASCEVVYSATKGFTNTFTKALAREVGPCNIKINAIACGLIDTAMNNNISETDKSDFIESVSLMKIGKDYDVAKLAYFLASEENGYLTGQVINLDGGFL